MAKFLKTTPNVLTNPDEVRAKALTLDYYTNANHPEIADGGEEWVCYISKDISKEAGILSEATIEVVNQLQKDINQPVSNYKTYCQYTTAASRPAYVHTDQYLLLKENDPMRVNYIANVYITPSDAQQEDAWFDFYKAKYISEGASMDEYLNLTSDELDRICFIPFEYNTSLAFDSSIPHKNAPLSNTQWGTDVTDSPLCFTVFMQTS